MTITTIDQSQRKAARVAGFTCLFTMAIVVFANFGIHERLMVAGDAAATARNIMAHEKGLRPSGTGEPDQARVGAAQIKRR